MIDIMELSLALNEFRKYISDKKVICYGAGLQGTRAIAYFENWDLQDRIDAFIDSNNQKWGGLKEYHGLKYPIISIEEAIKRILPDTVIVVTNIDVINIYKNIKKIDEFKTVPVTSLISIAEQELRISNYDSIVEEGDKPLIPNVIHYCWFGGEMPDQQKRVVEGWHDKCPDYEIKEWNESNYDINQNKYMVHAAENNAWAFVSDYARMDVVYKYGGFYFDTDVEILKNLDDLRYQKGFVTVDVTLLVNLGSGFGTISGHKLLSELMRLYEHRHFDRTPCQLLQYEFYRQQGYEITDRLQRICDANVYPMILQSTCAHSMKMRVSDKAYFAHYGTGLWEQGSDWKNARKAFSDNSSNELITYKI